MYLSLSGSRTRTVRGQVAGFGFVDFDDRDECDQT